MSTLTEARDEAREDSRTRPEERREPRTAAEASSKDTYYRPEYGWVMSDAQVKEEQAIRGKYDEAANSVRSQIDSNKAAYQTSIDQGRNSISSQYDNAIGKIQKGSMNLVPVRVVNGNTIEGVYMLPKETVEQMNRDSFNKGTGSYVGNWVDSGSNYNVDVRVKGGGARGQELHDALRGALPSVDAVQRQIDEAYNRQVENARREKDAAISGFMSSSQKNYDTAAQTWNAELQRVSGLYGQRLSTGKSQYEASKKKYNESIMNMDAGLLETPTSQVNPNA